MNLQDEGNYKSIFINQPNFNCEIWKGHFGLTY